MTFNPTDILAIIPEIGILALAMIVILLELMSPRQEKLFQWVAALGLIAVIALTVIFGNHGSAFSGMIALDGFSTFLIILITAVTVAVILISGDYLRGTNIRHGEYYGILMIASCGMMILVSATDLVTVFLGIETMSISL